MATFQETTAKKLEERHAKKKAAKAAGEKTERFNLVEYVKNSYNELKKVTWPTRNEAIRSTVVVVLFSIAVAGFLGALDFVFSAGLDRLIQQA